MPSRCPNSRLIVANMVSGSVRLLTSARTARLPAPSAFLAVCSDPSFNPQMATRAPSLSNSCAAASPIPLLPPVIRIFLLASLPIVVTPFTPFRRRLFCHWRGLLLTTRRQRRRHATLALSQFQFLSLGRGRCQRVVPYLLGLSTHRFHLPHF